MSFAEFKDFKKHTSVALISLMMLFTAFAGINVTPVKSLPPIEFTLYLTETTNPDWGKFGGYHDIWDKITLDLREIGIEVVREVYDGWFWWDRVFGSGWNKTYLEGGWDMFINEWWLQPQGLDPWFTSLVRSDLTPDEGGYNIFPWRNRDADYLLRDGMTEFNAAARKIYLDAWQEVFMKDPPWINLYYAKVYDVMGRYITGYEPSATGFYDTAHLTLNNTMLGEARPDRDPNTVVYAIVDEYWAMNPMFMNTRTEEQVSALCFRTLYKWSCDPFPTDGSIPSSQNYTIKPDMAKDYPTYLNNGQTVRVTLREGMVWRYHNGTTVPITADDVVWTFTTMMDPQAEATGSGDFTHMIKNVTKVNATTVDFNLNYAYPYTIVDSDLKYALYPDVLSILSNHRGTGAILPKHRLEGIPIASLRSDNTNLGFGYPDDWLPCSGPFMWDPSNPPTPDVDITLIKNPSYYGYNASIAGPVWMGYSLDGQSNVTIYGNRTLTSLPDGVHSTIVYANNNTGNIDASSKVYFTVDTTSPIISVLAPENKTYATENVPLTFTVNEAASWMGYSLDGQSNVTITGNTTLTSLPDGPHYTTVYANDTVGNMGASSKVYFAVDTTLPIVSVLSPENKTYATENVPLTFTVNKPTSWMGYSLDGQSNVTITGNTTLTSLPDGPHYTTVYANDTVGNMGASSKVYFTVIAPLTISILSPEHKTYATENVPLTFTVKEPTSGWGPHNINTFILQWEKSPAPRLMKYIAHDIDFGDYPTAPVATFLDLNNTANYPFLRVVQYDRPASNPIWLNFNNEYLSNRYVRMAIAHAIDYNYIIASLLDQWGIETAYRGKTPILPQHYYNDGVTSVQLFNTALPPYQYDPVKAQAYMDLWKGSQTGHLPYTDGPVGDADFNGIAEMTDFYIWRDDGFGHTMPIPFLPGQDKDPDFDNTGFIEMADFYRWRENWGNTYP